jgi:uncharacterized protein (DUF885 family)
MHTGQMTFDEGIHFFVHQGMQTQSIAEMEVRRGTTDPTYLYYTLGKLAILKLRDDYQRLCGASSHSLHAFHDAFLRQGCPPIPIVRRAMLGDHYPSSIL